MAMKYLGESFDMHLGGRVILHYRDVFGLPHSFVNGPGTPPAFFARTQPDTLYLNSAYLIMEGTIYKDWGYRVTSEVSTTTAGPNARLETTFTKQVWSQLGWSPSRLMIGSLVATSSSSALPRAGWRSG